MRGQLIVMTVVFISPRRSPPLLYAFFSLCCNAGSSVCRVSHQLRSRAEVKAPGIIPRKSVHEPVQVRFSFEAWLLRCICQTAM